MYEPHATPIKTEHFSLQEFLPIGELTDEVRTFLMPPFAGRDEKVTDNQVKVCQQAGRHVYRFVQHSAKPWWLGGTPFTFDDYIKAIDYCQLCIRNKHNIPWLDVVSDCAGTYPTAIHNSMNPHLYRRHAFTAGPFNCKTGQGGKIEDYCETANMDGHKLLVAMNGNIQPWIFQWVPFASMDPYKAFVHRWHKQANSVMFGPIEEARQRIENNEWHDNGQNLFGDQFLWIMEHHFVGNHVFDGTATVCGKTIDLGNITCPVHVYMGGGDEITLPEQARAVLDKVSSEEKHYKCFNEKHGHTAPFTWDDPLAFFVNEFYGAQA